MNAFDVAAILLIVVAAIAGFRSGALPQLFGLGGAILGGAIGLSILPILSDTLSALDPLPRAVVVIGGLLVIVAIGEGLGSSVGRRLGSRLGNGLSGAFDDIAGAFVGVAQGLLIVWLVGGLLAISPLDRLASLAQTSVVVRTLDTIVPSPETMAGQVAGVLDDSGLPDLFLGLEPLPAPPVDPPSDAQATAIGRLGAPSTVKVTSAACELVLTGTGIVVRRGYIVTNAHVVAGARTTRVVQAGQTYDATVVLFDPTLDVAVVRAPRLPAPALAFATIDPARGTAAAALGFPGGGPLTVVPAAVSRELQATGRDIYGEHQVTRSILELRAAIEQGDSGGPLVLADGTVGGLVFAEARADPDVGYALSPTAVAVRVAPALDRTEAVDTGRCIR